MAKYNYSTNVIPVFIERREEEIDAFATQWTVEAGNANGKNLIFDVTAYNPQADFYNAEFVAEIQLNSTGDTVLADQDTVLINNFFPKLFSRITVEWNGEIMEEINDPFVTSTVLKFITKSKRIIYQVMDRLKDLFQTLNLIIHMKIQIQEENYVKSYITELQIRSS